MERCFLPLPCDAHTPYPAHSVHIKRTAYARTGIVLFALLSVITYICFSE